MKRKNRVIKQKLSQYKKISQTILFSNYNIIMIKLS